MSFHAIDARVDDWWDRLRGNPALDKTFYVASELGDFSLLWHILGAGQGLVRPERTVRLALALGAESALVNGVVKSLFRRERPVEGSERPHRLRQPRTSSFPSGHASSAFMAAVVLSDDSRWAPLYFSAAAVVAASRIHVRIHHASDVAAGAALGLALGNLVKRWAPLGA